MRRALAAIAVSLLLGALAALVMYFVSEPDKRKTETAARKFDEAAVSGAGLGDAIRASASFKSVTFGTCGHLDASPDSGPKGSLIFVPTEGSFARYLSLDDFLRLNPSLLDHQSCRRVSVLYETIFPYRGQIDLLVDERGVIQEKSKAVFFF